jgi:hypothetical protein
MNPKAEEALKTNAAMRELIAYTQTKKNKHNTHHLTVIDAHGLTRIVECQWVCDKCPIRYKCFTEQTLVLTEEEWSKIDTTKGTGKTLDAWKETILREMSYVDIKPYSHNIISLSLNAIARGWGKEKANYVIRDYGLTALGWNEEKA